MGRLWSRICRTRSGRDVCCGGVALSSRRESAARLPFATLDSTPLSLAMAVMEFCCAVSGDTTVGPRELKTVKFKSALSERENKFKIAFIYPGSLGARRTLPCQMLQN